MPRAPRRCPGANGTCDELMQAACPECNQHKARTTDKQRTGS